MRDEAAALADEIAPEHLHIACQNPEELLAKIRHAGAVFLGNYSPVAVGDYVAGPSHVLPTGGTARFASGLSANDFLRAGSVIQYGREASGRSRRRHPDTGRYRRVGGPSGERRHPAERLSRRTTTRDQFPMSYFRPEIEQMHGYTPGEQPQGGKFIKLNTNENPYPASPAVARAIAAVLERGLGKYPDPMATAFRRRAGEILSVDPDWILCGNGSDDMLTIVTRGFVGQGQWLRLPYPSYILYKTLAQIQGAAGEEIQFQPDWSLGDDFAAAAARFAAGVFAESEQSVGHDAFRRSGFWNWPSGCPARCWSTRRTSILPTTTACGWSPQNEKILVSRSLSKSYALAGLRFGFVVAQPHDHSSSWSRSRIRTIATPCRLPAPRPPSTTRPGWPKTGPESWPPASG